MDSMNFSAHASTDGGDADAGEISTQSNQRKRKRISKVWEDFNPFNDAEGREMAKCKHCGKALVAASIKGTSHLIKHLRTCRKKSGTARSLSDTSPPYKFDQNKSRMDFATMVTVHNYPFVMADHEFFRKFVRGLNPEYKFTSRNTLRADVVSLHCEYKDQMYTLLDTLSSRVTLTTDIWTANNQNYAYASLTAHYIDEDWKLNKKILNFRKIEVPHDGHGLFRCVSEMILEWNLDKKIFSMVVDNASANDSMIHLLRTWLSENSALLVGGDYFHVRCSAHIMNLVVQDGLKVLGVNELLSKIRETVRYLSRSTYGKQKFDSALEHLKLKGKRKVPVDTPNRWNSTYDMLNCAIPLKDAFVRLAMLDKNYKFNPSESEWEVASMVRDCFELFYEATHHFSSSNIQMKLMEWERSENEWLRLMVAPMKDKFFKYWKECSLTLAIAVVLDPRYKMLYVEFWYESIYGLDANVHVQRVRDAFTALYNCYGGVSAGMADDDGIGSQDAENRTTFDFWYDQSRYNQAVQKSELDQYLDEPKIRRNAKFDILQWWKVNSDKLPILGRMARDVLAVPATTVASESAFSIGGRVIDETRNCLLPDIVENLITTADWIPRNQDVSPTDEV